MLNRAWNLIAHTVRLARHGHREPDGLLQALNDDPAWRCALRQADGPRILIATGMACYNHARVVERTLAAALTLRGARTQMLLCDRVLPACQMTKIQNSEVDALLARPDTPRCQGCLDDAARLFDPLGLPILRYGEFLTDADVARARRVAQEVPLEAIPAFCPDGLAVGEHAYAGALRFFARGDLDGEPRGEEVLRRFLLSGLLTASVMQRLLRKNRYDVAVFHHGIYTPQGIVGEACRAAGVRVVNWNPSYRRNTFVFSEGDTYHHTMIEEPVQTWSDITWNDEIERLTLEYLDSRRVGSADWIWFHESPEADTDALARELGIDWARPCVGLLTSVMWDAQLHYRANAFPDMLAWLRHTVEYFAGHPALQLLVRVHPAEIRGMVPSRQRVVEELARMFPRLPSNVFVIGPEHPASTYACMERCDSVLIFNTKTGIELACLGLPVIVAGEAWIRGKGFSIDASSAHAYDAILDTLPLGRRMDAAQVERARRYAFHFFFRRMLELPFISSPKKYAFEVELASLDDLRPGRHPGLDVICRGILEGTPFIDLYEDRMGVGVSPAVASS